MNRIFPEQLASNLNSHLAKVYFLVGTDPLLLSESEDLIHQAALLQGFDEKNQITIDTNTDWPALIEASQSMGLFFNKQIFILNLFAFCRFNGNFFFFRNSIPSRKIYLSNSKKNLRRCFVSRIDFLYQSTHYYRYGNANQTS